MPKTALIVGHKGQDGTYLTRLLREKGYQVAGTDRDSIDSDLPGLKEPLDIGSATSVLAVLETLRPDEIYYLAAFHHSSEAAPVEDAELIARSFAVNTLSLNHVLSGISKASPASRLFYASSSRVFGDPPTPVQNEATPLNPVCAYGISKVAGMGLCRYYRARGVYATCGILYNHESPLRPPQFISRKIVRAACRIRHGSPEKLEIGDLSARVDWGYAPDYADAMWRILQLAVPEDFVIGTGELHTVRDMVEVAFRLAGLDWREHVTERPDALRDKGPRTTLCADSSHLRSSTGWHPNVGFEAMIRTMIEAEETELAGN